MKIVALKYSKVLLLLSLLGFVVTGCSDDDGVASNFKIIETKITETPSDLEGTIELSSSDFEYVVRHDWCEVTAEGNMLKLKAGPNYDFLNRSTEIIITSGSVKYTIPVTQTGILFEFSENIKTSFKYGLNGGERSVRVLSNIDYEIIISENAKDWISIESEPNAVYNIIVKEGEERREGAVFFTYLDKTLKVDIEQYNYLSYQDLLGPATMTYKDSLNNVFTTEVEFIEKDLNKEFYLKGTFQSGVERMIPIQYLEELEGELRFRSTILEEYFQDNANSPKIEALCAMLTAKRTAKFGNPPAVDEPSVSATSKNYYPSSFEFISESSADVSYKFKHTPEGYPDGPNHTFSVIGMKVRGTNKRGSSAYGAAYDILYDIEIIKKMD